MRKHLLIVPACVLFICFNGKAQSNSQIREFSSPQAKAQVMLSKLYSACSPAGYQASKINYAFLDYYSERDDLAHQPHPTQSDFDAKLKTLKDKLNQKIQMVLTPEQMQLWVAYKQKEKIGD